MELNLIAARSSMVQKNERVELEMKIMKYRAPARDAADESDHEANHDADRGTGAKTARDRRVGCRADIQCPPDSDVVLNSSK